MLWTPFPLFHVATRTPNDIISSVLQKIEKVLTVAPSQGGKGGLIVRDIKKRNQEIELGPAPRDSALSYR